jgi:hypothetical protein
MAFATGAQTSLHYVAESTWGTTPSTPTWTPICYNSCSLGITKDSIEDDCLSSNRQVKGLVTGTRQSGGDIGSRLEYGSFDVLLEAALGGTWAANVLKVGTTERSFTFEKTFNLATDEYHRFTGQKINTMALSIQPNANVGLTFSTLGKDLDSANLTSQTASSTYGTASTNIPFNSFTGAITEGGGSTAIVTGLDITLENGYEPAFALMSTTGIEPIAGKSRVTGTVTAYYESKALYEKFLNDTASSIVVTLEDVAGNTLEIDLPSIKYTGGNPEVSGEGPVTVALEFTALYSVSDASQIVFTRTAA